MLVLSVSPQSLCQSLNVDYQPKLESLDRRKPWENKVGLIFFLTHSGYGALPRTCAGPLQRA